MAGGDVLRGGQVSISARREEIENMGDFADIRTKFPKFQSKDLWGWGSWRLGENSEG